MEALDEGRFVCGDSLTSGQLVRRGENYKWHNIAYFLNLTCVRTETRMGGGMMIALGA